MQTILGVQSLKVWLAGQSWWDHIRNDFVDIFQPIMIGLRRIHKRNKYHGNLLKGIVLQIYGHGCLYNVRGFLYDMQEVIRHNRSIHINEGKTEGFGDLIQT